MNQFDVQSQRSAHFALSEISFSEYLNMTGKIKNNNNSKSSSKKRKKPKNVIDPVRVNDKMR